LKVLELIHLTSRCANISDFVISKRGKSVPFSKISPSSRSLNSLKNGLGSPGKVLEFHLRQGVDTLSLTLINFEPDQIGIEMRV
jgi:hypothetical protein